MYLNLIRAKDNLQKARELNDKIAALEKEELLGQKSLKINRKQDGH